MDLKIYENTIKVKYRKRHLNLFELSGSSNIRRWMMLYFPNTTMEEHKRLRDIAKEKFGELDNEWSEVAKKEFLRVFLRRMEIWDYKVSGIVRDEFSDTVKNELRKLNQEIGTYYYIANSHNVMLPKYIRF